MGGVCAAIKCPPVPVCGMAFATLAAADRLLVLGEPLGALLVVSYEQRQFISHMDIRREASFI